MFKGSSKQWHVQNALIKDSRTGHFVKGIASDSNNIFLWHESEDINKKSLFPKFQLIPISRF